MTLWLAAPTAIAGHTESLAQSIESARRAERAAGDASVKSELSIARKGMEKAQELLKQANREDALKEMQGSRTFLRHVLDHPRGESKEVLGAVAQALDFLDQAIAGAQGFKPPVETARGLHTASFQVAQGRIKVYLPDDMMAGDTISGTVVLEPVGKDPEEQARNMDVLNGYVVEMAGQQTAASHKTAKWIIPAAAAVGGVIPLVLKTHGSTSATAAVPLQTTTAPSPTPQVTAPSPTDYHLPAIGQAGRPVQILGPFDGDSTNTTAAVGGSPITVLAESPRKLVAQSPRGAVGPSGIEITERGVTASRPYNNVSVTLSSPRLKLQKGETTTVTAAVAGLQNLPAEAFPIRLDMVNQTPSVASMMNAQGNVYSHQITQDQVSAAGAADVTTQLVGRHMGEFTLMATLALLDEPCCELKKIEFKTGGKTKGSEETADWLEKVKDKLEEEGGETAEAIGEMGSKMISGYKFIVAINRPWDIYATLIKGTCPAGEKGKGKCKGEEIVCRVIPRGPSGSKNGMPGGVGGSENEAWPPYFGQNVDWWKEAGNAAMKRALTKMLERCECDDGKAVWPQP